MLLGIDVGSVRVGVAASDPGRRLASPVETVRRDGADLARIAEIAGERAAVEVVVGWPISLSGAPGPAAEAAVRYAGLLARRLAGVPVSLVDERLSTVAAARRLTERGMRAREQRASIDAEAAVVLLQAALDGAPTRPLAEVAAR